MRPAWLLVFVGISVLTGNACMDVRHGMNLSCSLLILVGGPKMICPPPVQLSHFHGMYRNIDLQLNFKWTDGKENLGSILDRNPIL